MNIASFRRFGAIAGAAAVTIAITSSTVPATAGPRDQGQVRPCFTVRSHWNNAEGPQPTCPSGRFATDSSEQPGAARIAARVADFMP